MKFPCHSVDATAHELLISETEPSVALVHFPYGRSLGLKSTVLSPRKFFHDLGSLCPRQPHAPPPPAGPSPARRRANVPAFPKSALSFLLCLDHLGSSHPAGCLCGHSAMDSELTTAPLRQGKYLSQTPTCCFAANAGCPAPAQGQEHTCSMKDFIHGLKSESQLLCPLRPDVALSDGLSPCSEAVTQS